MELLLQDHRLIEHDKVGTKAATATLRPRAVPNPLAAEELEALLPMRPHHLPNTLRQVRVRFEDLLHAVHRDHRRRELVRAVDDQPLLEQEDPGELPDLEHRALAVLPRHA